MSATRKVSLGGCALLACMAILAACDNAPGEAELVAACQKEGQRGVNSVGMDRDKFCKCAARAALDGVSADGRRLMAWEMEGNKRQEIAALQSKMSDEEKMQVMKASFEVLGKCMDAG